MCDCLYDVATFDGPCKPYIGFAGSELMSLDKLGCCDGDSGHFIMSNG